MNVNPITFRALRIQLAVLLLVLPVLKSRKQKWLLAVGCACIYGASAVLFSAGLFHLTASHAAYWACLSVMSVALIGLVMRCPVDRAALIYAFALDVWLILYHLRAIPLILFPNLPKNALEVFSTAAVYAPVFYFCRRNGLVGDTDSHVNVSDIIMIGLIYLTFQYLDIAKTAASESVRCTMHFVLALSCGYIIMIRAENQAKLRAELKSEQLRAIWQQQKKQYEVMESTITMINHKCHDMKHLIRSVQHENRDGSLENYIQELKKNISIYDTKIQTGNRALDIVLMEKGLVCCEKGIHWSCMADGTRMDFIQDTDIYAIFGNLLDNAIEAVEREHTDGGGVIHMTVACRSGMIFATVDNMYSGKLVYSGDALLTTKDDPANHGYGLMSVERIVSSYDGVMTIDTADGIFSVQIMIPCPQA